MILKSDLLTQASGSIGGVTYSHGRAGLQRSGRRRHTNTATNVAKQARALFTGLTHAWSSILTEPQRVGWANYAKSTPMQNRLGDVKLLSGSAMYLRCNATRAQALLARVDDAPTTLGLAEIGPWELTNIQGASIVLFNAGAPRSWINDPAGAIIIQTSRFESPGHKKTTSSMRHWGSIVGDQFPPQNVLSKATNAFGQPAADAMPGLKLTGRVVVVLGDGRISTVEEKTTTNL